MIAHICERFFSGAGSSEVTDNIATGLIRALINQAPVAIAEPEIYEARANIMWSGTLAHNDLAGCGLNAVPTSRAGGWGKPRPGTSAFRIRHFDNPRCRFGRYDARVDAFRVARRPQPLPCVCRFGIWH